tara:strand:- start:310 stop:1140 length:831 start_codon:yes stop_codon:yes gene_type:complete
MASPIKNIFSNGFLSEIKKIYDRKTYFESYGDCIMISAVVVVIYTLFTGYFYILGNSAALKEDWENIRCNPLYMPFVSLINKPPNESKLTFTARNFNVCVANILEKNAKKTMNKYAQSNNQLAESSRLLLKSGGSNRGFLTNLKNKTGGGFTDLTEKIDNFKQESVKPFRIINDTLDKTLGISATSVYTLLTLKYSIRPIVSAMIGIIIIMIMIFITIIVLNFPLALLLGMIPIVGPFLAIVPLALGFASKILLIATLIVGIPAIILCSVILSIDF